MIRDYMKVFLRYLKILGIDPIRCFYSLRGLPDFLSEYIKLKDQLSKGDGVFALGRLYPCLEDRYQESGQVSGHYFHQDLLVAQSIFTKNPRRHVDVGSRVDGFVAHVASFRSIEAIDIRPLISDIENITYLQMDLMEKPSEELHECTDSLSCLHALEHFGLGRYGDPINWNGHLVGFDNLLSILSPGGKLYFSVPIGIQRIEFNAHRVFSIAYLLEMFAGGRLRLDHFAFVDDSGELHKNISLDEQAIITNCGCEYGCGIFELTKHVGSSTNIQ